MKILSYEEDEEYNMLRVTTDFAPMPEFVYPLDQFPDAASLEAEINKKIAEVTKRTVRKAAKKLKLKKDLDAKVKK